MRNTFGRNLLFGALWASFSLPLAAETIFDNSANDLVTRFDPATLEVGDQIQFAGTDRAVTDFSFEYWAINSNDALKPLAGNVKATVRFYYNDGPVFNGEKTPGTMFFESAPFALAQAGDPLKGATERNTLNFTTADFPNHQPITLTSSEITWSVQFSGWGVGDRAGVDIYSPATIGKDFPDYWQNDPDQGWLLLTNAAAPLMDFAAKFDATAVPEPGVLSLSLLGGFGLISMRWLRRK